MQTTITNNTDAQEFQLRAGDEVLSRLTYKRGDDAIALTHAETADGHGGQGYAGQVTQYAIEFAQREGLGVLPMCSYVRDYMLDRRELLAMVPARYRDGLGLNAAIAAAQQTNVQALGRMQPGAGAAQEAGGTGAERRD